MDVKLESLIEKIKKDGLEEAKKTSEEVIARAHQEGAGIVNDAKEKAKKILEEAQEETRKLKANTENSLRQAARDLVLVLKEQIINSFDRILKHNIQQAVSPDFMKELISGIIDKWSSKKASAFEALVNARDKKKLEELLFSQFRKEARNMIEIKVASGIDKGFRIGIKGEDVHYDFTDQSILESLKEFLNPAISEMLDSK